MPQAFCLIMVYLLWFLPLFIHFQIGVYFNWRYLFGVKIILTKGLIVIISTSFTLSLYDYLLVEPAVVLSGIVRVAAYLSHVHPEQTLVHLDTVLQPGALVEGIEESHGGSPDRKCRPSHAAAAASLSSPARTSRTTGGINHKLSRFNGLLFALRQTATAN